MRTASEDMFEAMEGAAAVGTAALATRPSGTAQGLARFYRASATAEQANRDYESGDLLTDMPWTPARPSTPEKRLLFAIIVDAWDRIAAFRRAERAGRVSRETRRDAVEVFRWVEGRGESEPRIFSFEAICDHLGWDTPRVRVAFYGDVQHVGMGQQGTRAKVGLRRERRSSRARRLAAAKQAGAAVAAELREAS